MNYKLQKGELNKLNNLNQDLKTIFSSYLLLDNGKVIGTSILNKGSHVAYTDFKIFFTIPTNLIIKLYSQDIFKAIKDNKKKIKFITIVNNDIYFTGDDDIFIKFGELVNKETDYSDKVDKYDKIINTTIDDDGIEINEDGVISLVKNEYINISLDKYRTRITKEVIPGLKKSHNVALHFSDNNKNKDLFYLIITTKRSTCISNHIYSCLYM